MEHAIHTNIRDALERFSEREIAAPFKINIIGKVQSFLKEGKTLILNDGTAQIAVQWLESEYQFTEGDTIIVIGRIHDAGTKTILPDVMKKTHPLWQHIRALTTPQKNTPAKESPPTPEQPNTDRAISIIRELDQGSGADMEKVMTALGVSGEELIKKLLMAGEIFESKPGRLRIL